MVIGVLQIELLIPHSQSLKDKRRVVRSFKDRLHREHQVSVAEVGHLDSPRVAMLAVAVAAPDAERASAVMDKAVAKAGAIHDARLGAVRREIVHGSAIDWSADPAESLDPAAGAPVWSDEQAVQAELEARRWIEESAP